MNNPVINSNEIEIIVNLLKQGRVILCPTDTIWGLSCNALDEQAIKKILKIKHRSINKGLIVLVSSWEMLKNYIPDIPQLAYDLENKSPRPITIIYPNPINLPSMLIDKENTVAIRIVRNDFCKEIINSLGLPIVSTSANISGKPTPINFNDIDPEIKSMVDYIVSAKYDYSQTNKPSRLIKIINDNEYIVIRE